MSRALCAFLVMLALCACANAASIGEDCSPSGLINSAKEAVSPASFWKNALREIDAEVDGLHTMQRLNQLQRQKDRADEARDAQEVRAMGVTPIHSPEMDRLLAETDRDIAALDYRMAQRTEAWATKCRLYATRKLHEGE